MEGHKMISLQGVAIGALALIFTYLVIENHNLSDEVEQLKIEIRYNKSLEESNKTREKVFSDLNTTIERVHIEEVNDINDTIIGGTINFNN